MNSKQTKPVVYSVFNTVSVCLAVNVSFLHREGEGSKASVGHFLAFSAGFPLHFPVTTLLEQVWAGYEAKLKN